MVFISNSNYKTVWLKIRLFLWINCKYYCLRYKLRNLTRVTYTNKFRWRPGNMRNIFILYSLGLIYYENYWNIMQLLFVTKSWWVYYIRNYSFFSWLNVEFPDGSRIFANKLEFTYLISRQTYERLCAKIKIFFLPLKVTFHF